MKTVEKVQTLERACNVCMNLMADLHRVGDMFNPESKFIEHLDAVVDELIRTTSLLIDDNADWVHWFMYETSFGLKSNGCSLDGVAFIVRSPKDLVDAIERDNKIRQESKEKAEAPKENKVDENPVFSDNEDQMIQMLKPLLDAMKVSATEFLGKVKNKRG